MTILGANKMYLTRKIGKSLEKLGNLLTQLENLEHEWINLEKLELEILEMSPYRTLENKAGSSPAW